MCTSADVAPVMVSDAFALPPASLVGASRVVGAVSASASTFGWNVLLGGAVPAGSVCASNVGMLSLGDALTPG